MNKKDIIVTHHANIRALEIGLPLDKIKDLLLDSKRQKANIRRQLYKIGKYGYKESSVSFFFRKGTPKYPSILFTVVYDKDKWIVSGFGFSKL